MTMTVTFACTLCRCNLKPQGNEDERNRYGCGYGLRWEGVDSRQLARGARWEECPIHLCEHCIEQVAKIHEGMPKR